MSKWKCFFVGGVVVFSSLAGAYGSEVTRKYKWDELENEQQVQVKGKFETQEFKEKFKEEGSYVKAFDAEKAETELRCTGVCKIEVAAAPLEFSIERLEPVIVKLDEKDRLVCQAGFLAKITAPFSTMAKITLNGINSSFREGKHHFLKVMKEGSDGTGAVFLHKNRTTGQIVVDSAGVNVYCLLSSTECAAGNDSDGNGGCTAIPSNQDLGEFFPEIKLEERVDFGATYNISIEAEK